MICKDHTVSMESFAITKCNDCQFQFTNPRPTKENIGAFYESKDYLSHNRGKSNLLSLPYKIARHYSIRRKYNIINQYVKEGPILDIGCGTGEFLKYFKSKSWKVQGTEPTEVARISAEKNINQNVYSELSELDSTQKYKVITLWHVLEHIHELNETLGVLKRLKGKKGRIFIAVPNPMSFDAGHYKENWAAYDVPRHLYHFTPVCFKDLLSRHKLKIQTTHPMPFDSFYVSLLSEKYKTGQYNYLEAIRVANKSNKLAKHTNNYSSLLYVIK
ncbi:MAG: class I SAM-dependent methyltransferase [Bacteroidota bacterium]